MKAFIYKTKRRRNGALVKSHTWYACLKFDGDAKECRINLQVADERVAQEKLRILRLEHEQESVNLIPSKQLREAAQKSLQHHLGSFIADLRRRGRAEPESRIIDIEVEQTWNDDGEPTD